MSPAEQEQRVICEVLQGHGYDVEAHQGAYDVECCWVGTRVEHDQVWAIGVPWVYAPCPQGRGPYCSTPEEAIAWVLANVPRPAASTEAP